MLYASLSDFYSLLQIPRDASPNDIKIAYHRTLLRLHPDKQHRSRVVHSTSHTTPPAVTQPCRPSLLEEPVDMASVKEAYRTLSDVDLRTAYDGSLRRAEHARSHGPRPAQVVSLEEFVLVDAEGCAAQAWRYRCRCGGMYRITERDLEDGMHLVGCECCSEVIWVGYEEAIEEDEEEE